MVLWPWFAVGLILELEFFWLCETNPGFCFCEVMGACIFYDVAVCTVSDSAANSPISTRLGCLRVCLMWESDRTPISLMRSVDCFACWAV